MRRLIFAAAVLGCAAGPPDEATLARYRRIRTAVADDARGVSLWRAGKQREAAAVRLRDLAEREKMYPASTHRAVTKNWRRA